MGGRTRSLFGFLVVLVVGAQLLHIEPTYAAAANEGSGLTCSFFGFVLRPFGYCSERSTVPEPVVEERNFNIRSLFGEGLVAGEATSSNPSPIVASASTGLGSAEARAIAESVYEQNLRSIQEQNALMVALSMLSDRRAFSSLYQQMNQELSDVREALTRTISNTREDLSGRGGSSGGTVDLSVGGTLSSPTLGGTITITDIPVNALLFTNSAGVLSGVSGLGVDDAGNLLLGTTTAQEQLTVAGPVFIGDATPTTTTNRLYSIAGSLYWNGSIVAASSSANWTASAGNVYRPTGSVGIGTSSPAAALAVVGDIALTGGIYDSSYSLGSTGMVLQSSGSGVAWVATNTLGLAPDLSGSSLEDLGDIAAITNDFGDLLYWNGSAWADIATGSLAINTDDLIEGSNLFYTDARVATYINSSSTILKGNTETELETFLTDVSNVFTNNDTIGDANIADTITASNYLLLSDWYGTTTDGVSEGALNRYYSTTLFAADLAGTSTDALAEGVINQYFTLGRFAAALSGTTTDALNEGGSNLYYTDARVASYINSSSSISKLGASIDESELNIATAPVDGYLLQASSTAVGGLSWVATGTLGFSGGGATTFKALTDTPGSFAVGDILYSADGTNLTTLAAGGNGTVLKISGGVPSWGADLGGAGGGGVWASSSDDLLIYPADTNDVVVIGGSATTTTGYDLEVIGSALVTSLNTNTLTATTTNVLGNLDVNGGVTLGSTALLNANRILNLEDDISNNNNFFAAYTNPRVTATISGSRSGYASYNLFEADAITEGANNYEAVAVYGEVQVDGSSSVGSSRAGQFIVDYNSTTGIGDNAYTLSSNLSVAGGATVNTGYGYFSDLDIVGSVNNYYGIFLQDVVEGTMVNAYAFWANEGDMVLDGDGNGIAGGNDGGSDLFLGEGQDAAIWYNGTNLNINPRVVGSGSVVIPSGRLGIGSSSPIAALSVTGDIALTGGIYDSNSDQGSNGQLLANTGSGVDWISTSTLGLITDDVAEGSNLYYTDARVASYIVASSTILNQATESGLESYLSGVTNVFTDNDTIGADNGGTGQSSYAVGDILYATGATSLSKLAAGGNNTVLKISGGVPSWGTDESGAGGSTFWSTTTDELAIYTADPTDVVIIGGSATTSTGFNLEVIGDALFSEIQTGYATITDLVINNERLTDLTGDGLQNSSNVLTVNCADLEGTGIQCVSSNFAIDFSEFDTDSITEGSTNFWGKWGEGFGTLYYAPGSERVGIGDTDADYTLELAGSNNNGYFGISTNAAGDGNIFEIDNNGDVGIGTNAPGEKLHIANGNLLLENTHSIRWENNAASENTIMAYDSSNNLQIGSGIGNNLQLYGTNNQIFYINGSAIARFDSTGDFGLGDTSPDFKFEIAATSTNGYFGITNSSDGDIFTVLEGGNVGIGTTSPSRLLSVAGDIYATGALYDSSGSAGANGYVLVSSSTGFVWSATNTLGLSSGTVTSVAAAVPTGWTISGSPITGAGTLTFDYDLGYGAVLTASSSNWNTFYDTPSSQITAGTGLSWTGNTLNAEVQTSDLANYFLLSDWYATTTDALDEGSTNQYFTNARVASYINSSSTIWNDNTEASLESYLTGVTDVFTDNDVIDASNGGTGIAFLSAGELLIASGTSEFVQIATGSLAINTDDLVEGNTNLFSNWTVNGSDIYYTGGSVGIGTSSPSAELAVAGDFFLEGGMYDNLGTQGNNGEILFTTGSGVRWVATNTLGFKESLFTDTGSVTHLTDTSDELAIGTTTLGNAKFTVQSEGTSDIMNLFETGGTEVFTVLENGNVGIGSTTPSATLDVAGDIFASGGITGQVGSFTNSINDDFARPPLSLTRMRTDNSDPLAGFGPFIDFVIQGADNSLVVDAGGLGVSWEVDQTNNTTARDSRMTFSLMRDNTPFEAARFTSNGNLGIGTTSPASKLDVWGDLRIGTSSTPTLFSDVSTGRVGVGTAAPNGNFEVVSNSTFLEQFATVYSSTETWHAPYLVMRRALGSESSPSAVTDGDSLGELQWRGYTSSSAFDEPTAGIYARVDGSPGATYAPGRIGFETMGTDGSSAERMVIKPNGNIGIGTGTPASKLDIWGDFRVGTSSQSLVFADSATERVGILNIAPGAPLHVGSTSVTDSATLVRLEDANSVCNFNADGSAPSCGSDLSLKKSISVIEDELTRLLAIEPSSWLWKTDGAQAERKFGFIAQDVEEQFPELVTESLWVDGTKRKFLNQGGLMPYVVGAIKEQQETLEDMLATGSSTKGASSPFYRFFDGNEDTVWERLVAFAQDMGDGVLELTGLQAAVVYSSRIETDELCLDGNCITSFGELNTTQPSEQVVYRSSDTNSALLYGVAEVPRRSTSTMVTFETPFIDTPVVVLTPASNIFGDWFLLEASSTGFIIELEAKQERKVNFNWQAHGRVEDSVSEPTEVPVPSTVSEPSNETNDSETETTQNEPTIEVDEPDVSPTASQTAPTTTATTTIIEVQPLDTDPATTTVEVLTESDTSVLEVPEDSVDLSAETNQDSAEEISNTAVPSEEPEAIPTPDVPSTNEPETATTSTSN